MQATTEQKPEAPPVRRMHGPNIFDESRPMWRYFLVFLTPLMLSSVLQSAGSTLNSIFVGRLIGVDALGAISSFFPLLFLLFSFLAGLASGASVLIGQAYGAGDQHKMKRVTGTVLSMGLSLGIVVTLVGLLFADRVMSALGTPQNIFSDALGYARIVLVFSPVLFVYIIYVSALRGTGDSQTPFYALIVSTVLGILVTPALIRGWFDLPRLGVLSAAVALVISNLIAFIGMLIYLRVRRHPLALDKEIITDLRFDPRIAKRVVQIGVPTGLQFVMVSLAEIAVLSFVNRFGSHATAAYGAVNQVVSYVQFPAISMSLTASIFVAQCIGAGRNDKLGSVVHVAVALNYIVGAFLVVLCYLFAWNILGWFITDLGTLRIAHTLLFITLWGYLIFGNSAVLSGVMRASGSVLWPTAISIFGIWGVEVPTAYILMHRIGLDGIWIGYPVAFCVTLLLQSAYYFLVWKKQRHERLI